jgi:predicted ArsR family transcriptional regulator
VENTLGPRPPRPDRPEPRLSRARAAVLAAVEDSPGPGPLARLAARTGLHANTLREHLDALVADGLVDRGQEAPHGRGRPASLYRAARPETSPLPEYAGLAAALAATIHRTSPTPVDDAVLAGTSWGHDLASAAGPPEAPTAASARRQVVEVLDGMGFDPQPDDEHAAVRLTRCPLLDTARRYPDVVCAVHLGIARGALAEYGADGSEVTLEPFAEPGACVLHLTGPERR